MNLKPATHASSVGYLLPGRGMGPRATAAPAASGTARRNRGQAEPGAQDREDTVKRDKVWRELVWRERRAALEWEECWDDNKKAPQKGQVKPDEPLPSCFSDHVPNTANQIFGSRLYTPLGRELVRLDRLMRWPGSRLKYNRKPKADASLGKLKTT